MGDRRRQASYAVSRGREGGAGRATDRRFQVCTSPGAVLRCQAGVRGVTRLTARHLCLHACRRLPGLQPPAVSFSVVYRNNNTERTLDLVSKVRVGSTRAFASLVLDAGEC